MIELIGINEYYSSVYFNLITKIRDNVIKAESNYKHQCAFPENDFLDVINLLDVVYEKYGFDMHRQLQPAYEHLIIYQNCFLTKLNIESVKVAIEFVLLCCLVDKILDSPRFSNNDKHIVCEKLDIKYLTQEIEFYSDNFVEIDIFLNMIKSFLNKSRNTAYYETIIDSIQKAFKSEIYMSKNFLELNSNKIDSDEIHFLIDKSIEFEKAAFLLTVIDFQNDECERIAMILARIIWLVDDVADFVEDIQCKRINSLLYYFVDDKYNLTLQERINLAFNNIDNVYDMLLNLLNSLQDFNEELYNIMLIQVWDWCDNVRRYIEKET